MEPVAQAADSDSWRGSVSECGRSVIHDLQSEVSGDYGKALLILAEVLEPSLDFWDRQGAHRATQNRMRRAGWRTIKLRMKGSQPEKDDQKTHREVGISVFFGSF